MIMRVLYACISVCISQFFHFAHVGSRLLVIVSSLSIPRVLSVHYSDEPCSRAYTLMAQYTTVHGLGRTSHSMPRAKLCSPHVTPILFPRMVRNASIAL